MSVSGASTRLQALEAMRDVLAYAIDDCDSTRDLPALVRQMREVLAEMATLHAEEPQEGVAERLKRERANR